MNKPFLLAVMGLCVVLFCATRSNATTMLNPGRPLLAIEGVTRSDLASDIISVSVDSSQNRLEVTLNNWSTSPVGYKYSDGTLFLPGVHVALFLGPETSLTNVFDGTITTCAPHFSGDGPSTLTFTATRTTPPLKQNQLTMAFGADLMTFHPTLAAKGVIECTGVTMGNPDIQPGTVLTITGVV